MPRDPKGEKRPADVIGDAVRVMEIATGQRDAEYEAPEIEAEAALGFNEGDASVVRDNAKALKFRDGPTGFFEE